MKRMFRSFVGWFVELGEDPELILKQNIRDLEDQIPMLNENIALVKANETLHRKELEKLGREEADITSKIKASLKQGNRELAMSLATNLEKVRASRAQAERDLALAAASFEQARKAKQAFLHDKERKVAEARAALNAKKKAAWQAKVADAMEKFTVAGVDGTHEEMIRKIEESAAQSEAKLEIALENVETTNAEISKEAQKMRAADTLRQFELELGLAEEGPARELAPDVSAPPTAAPRERTIGRERERA